ncbi:MAG: hypothetical protein AAGL18_12985 [Pseudomonadota bacterium]
MHKPAIVTALVASVFMASNTASAQLLNPLENRQAFTMIDRMLSKLPDKIECISLVEYQKHNYRDTKTKQASAQKHIFRLTNMNLKLTGGYLLMEDEPSTVIYSLTSGGSDMNIIVGLDLYEGKILAIAPPLPQPNSCQAGQQLFRM